MGATIDDLRIKLQGDSKSANKEIDTVIKNLQNLSTALGGFKSVPGLQSVTKAFNEMKTATNGIDAGNIKNISNSIRSLASSLMSLDKSARSLNLSAAQNQMRVLDNIIKNESSKLMQEWGISAKDSAGVVESSIKKIVTSYKGISESGNSIFGKGAFDDAVQSIKPLITYMDKTDTSYQGLLDHIAKTNSNSKVFLPFSPSDFPDFDVMRATLGKAFSTSATGATDLTAYVRDLNSTLGHTVDIGTSDQETFENLYRVVSQARSEVERTNASFQRMATESGMLQSAINGVVRSVSEMNASMNNGFGVQNKVATAEMQGSNFEGLARQIGSLSGIDLSNIGDTSKLVDLAKNISQLGHKGITQAVANLPQLTEGLKRFVEEMNKVGEVSFNAEGLSNLTSSISRLGSKTSTVAVENIPKLQVAIKNLLTDLSKAPAISDNTVRSLEAMANIAQRAGGSFNSANNGITGFTNKTVSNFDKIKNAAGKVISAFGKVAVAAGKVTGINRLINGIRNLIPATNKAQTGFKGLAQKIGMLYASSFLVSRGFSHLKSAVSSAMDYVEEYDYFKNTFNEIAKNADLSQWKELGYKSAEAYANSFRERAEKVTSLMTGYSVDENGALFETGEKNLGLNPTQMMHTQALFGQMSNSMGVATETASKLSRVYTKLGADMASAFNMDFAQVYENLQSGMTGMSRAVDKYGVNIRNAAMQEELHRLGIDASITKLSQQDKVLLRTIITLNSTKQAWGNLAQTISSPSNQIRLLSQNFSMLSQMLGSLFLPVVSKVLPYINALVIAFKSLVSYVGGLLGIDLSDYMKGISAGGDNEALSAAYDDAENLSDGLDDVGKSADKAAKKQKKFNKQLAAFDELNNYTTSESEKNPKGSSASSSGAPNVGADLTAALDDAIKEYEKAWQKAFDGMENDANNIAEKIKKAFVKAWSTGNGSEIGQALANLINKGLSWVNNNSDTFASGLKNIANILATGLNGFINDFDWKTLGEVIGNGFKAITDASTQFFDVTNWERLGKGIGKTLNSAINVGAIESFFKNVGSKVRAAIETAFGFSKEFDFGNFGIHVGKGINEFIAKIDKVTNGLNGWQKAGKTVSNFLVGAFKTLSNAIKTINFDKIGKGITDFIASIDFKKVAEEIANLSTSIFNAFNDLLDNIDWNEIGEKLGEFVGTIFVNLPKLMINGFKLMMKARKSVIELFIGFIKGVVTTVVPKIPGMIKDIFENLPSLILEWLKLVKSVNIPIQILSYIIPKAVDVFMTARKNLKSAWKNIVKWWKKNAKLPEVIATIVAIAKEKVKGAIDKLKDKWVSIKNKTASLVATAKEKVSGALSSLKSGWDSVKSKAVSLIATAKEKTKGALSNLKSAWESIKNKSASLIAEAKEKVKGALESLGVDWDSIKSKTATLTANVVDKASGVLDGIKSNWSNLKDGVINIGVNISTKAKDIKEKVQNIVKQLGDKTVTLKAKISSKAKDIQDSWSTFKKTVGNKVLNFKANIASKASDIQTAFNNFKDSLKNKVISFGVTLAANAENAKEAVETLASNLAGKVVDLKVKLSTKVSEIWGAFKQGASSLWEKTVTFGAKIGTSAGNIWDNFKKNASSLWNKVVSFGAGINLPSVADIKSSIKEKWDSAINKLKGFKIPINFSFTVSAMKSVINAAIGWINKYIIGALNKISIKIPKIEVFGKKIFNGKTIGFNIKNIPTFAQGGFPKTGELFIANEAGPELIGRMNNKNAVANQSDIADGISDAVFNALNPLMTRMANAIVGLEQSMNSANGRNTLSVEGVSDGDIVRIVRNENTAYRRRTGRGMFA